MIDNWRKTTIGELCDQGLATIQTGPFGSQLHSYDYQPVGVPVVPTEAIKRRRLITEGLPRVSSTIAERLSRHKIRAGDILFARRGAQATGLSAIAEKENEGWLCGTGAMLLRILSPQIQQNFLSFVLSSDDSIAWLKAHAVGAVMPNLNEDVIRGMPLFLPPFSEQHAIAHILGTLDDKIELNRRMNETLEAIARSIFKAWFIDSTADRIPRGWKTGMFGEIAENMRRGAQPEDISPSTPYIGLEHMPRQTIALAEWGTVEEVTSNKSLFKQGEILFGKLRPYFHKVGIASVDGVCSTDILVIAPKSPEWFGLTLFHVSSAELVNHTNAASTGTKMPRTSWQDIARYEIVIPPIDVANAFNQHVLPVVGRIRSNIMESRTLTALRDALLPKLLSGEIRVSEL